MDRREQLMENYENALFALLMDEVAVEEGKRLLKENARLKLDPSAVVPPSAQRRSRQTLRRAFSRDERRHALRVTSRVLQKVALAAMLAASLFVTAYAVSPEVRVDTLNMLIETSDVASRLNLVEEESKKAATKPVTSEENLLFGYALPTVPEGFKEFERGTLNHGAWIEYKRGNDESIYIDVSKVDFTMLDTEVIDDGEAQACQVHGYEGMQVLKNQRVQIVWLDTEEGYLISLICKGVDESIVITMANEIVFVENN